MQELNGRTAMPTVAAKTDAARAIQQEQAFLMLAMQVPRNEELAIEKIISACQEISLAESAIYSFPKGTTTVSGPSIRLAENIATHWGRIDSGWSIVDEDDDGAEIYTWAVDLSSLNRATRRFRTPFIRVTRQGNYKITDPRDRFELCANQAARRMRACLLQIIPAGVVEDAVEQCKRTMQHANKTPLSERIKSMIKAFQEQFNIPQSLIEKRFNHKIEALTEPEMVTLRGIYQSLKDGAGKTSDFFESVAPNVDAEVKEVKKPEAEKVAHADSGEPTDINGAVKTAEASPPAQPAPAEKAKRSHRAKEKKEENTPVSTDTGGATVKTAAPKVAQELPQLNFEFGS